MDFVQLLCIEYQCSMYAVHAGTCTTVFGNDMFCERFLRKLSAQCFRQAYSDHVCRDYVDYDQRH